MLSRVVSSMNVSKEDFHDHDDCLDHDNLLPNLNKDVNLSYTKILENQLDSWQKENLRKCSLGGKRNTIDKDGEDKHRVHIQLTIEQESCYDFSYEK